MAVSRGVGGQAAGRQRAAGGEDSIIFAVTSDGKIAYGGKEIGLGAASDGEAVVREGTAAGCDPSRRGGAHRPAGARDRRGQTRRREGRQPRHRKELGRDRDPRHAPRLSTEGRTGRSGCRRAHRGGRDGADVLRHPLSHIIAKPSRALELRKTSAVDLPPPPEEQPPEAPPEPEAKADDIPPRRWATILHPHHSWPTWTSRWHGGYLPGFVTSAGPFPADDTGTALDTLTSRNSRSAPR